MSSSLGNSTQGKSKTATTNSDGRIVTAFATFACNSSTLSGLSVLLGVSLVIVVMTQSQ